MSKITVGLFGTCGGSTWRDPFINQLTLAGIDFFNPQLGPGEWNEDCAVIEAEHLATDEIVLFPVTDESYGLGSLAETGFSISNAMKLDDRRDFVILIAKSVNDELKKNEELSRESIKMRALVLQHLKKLKLPNVYLVDTLAEMHRITKALYESKKLMLPFKKYQIGNES